MEVEKLVSAESKESEEEDDNEKASENSNPGSVSFLFCQTFFILIFKEQMLNGQLSKRTMPFVQFTVHL